MKLKALTVAVFLATISYSFSAINNSTVTDEPSKSPAADTRTNSTQQNGNHTNSPTKKTTEPFTEAASKQTTTKLVPKSKPTKGTQVNNTRYTPAPSQKSQKTKPSTKPTTTHKKTNTATKPITTPKPTTTPKPEITCEMRNESCSVCLKDSSCFYCNSDNTCKMKKKGKILPSGCKGNKWYWKQCKILGNILIIVIPTVGGVFLIMLGCCIYCCCCRRCSKNRAAREETRQHQRRADRQERNAERKQDRKSRHDAIRMKYGLLQNMDDDEDDDPVA